MNCSAWSSSIAPWGAGGKPRIPKCRPVSISIDIQVNKHIRGNLQKPMSPNSKANHPVKLRNKKYTKLLRKLQGELCVLQEWIKYKGLRAIIIFEGRDAAGKGG